MVEKKSVSFKNEIFTLIEKRSGENQFSRSEIINRDLGRYYKLLYLTQMKIFEKFSESELTVIFEACKGCSYNIMHDGLLLREVAVAHTLGQLKKTEGCDVDELLTKIMHLNKIEEAAVIDLMERYWSEVEKGRSELTLEELKKEELQLYRENLRYA